MLSNVRGACSEPLSSPVALRSAPVTVNYQNATPDMQLMFHFPQIRDLNDTHAIQMEDASYGNGVPGSHSPVQIPTSLNCKPSYQRARSSPTSSALLGNFSQSQWTSYRAGSFASTNAFSPASEYAPNLGTPPLLYPNSYRQHSVARYSYTSEQSDSRKPSYSSSGSYDDFTAGRHHQQALSAPTGGLGLILDGFHHKSAIHGMRDRGLSSSSMSPMQEEYFDNRSSQEHSPATSLSFSDASEGYHSRKRAYMSGEGFPFGDQQQAYYPPEIIAPRPRYALSSSPAFLSPQFQPTVSGEESSAPGRHSLYSAHYHRSVQDYEQQHSPIEWQQSFFVHEDDSTYARPEQDQGPRWSQFAQQDGVSPHSGPVVSRRPSKSIPLPQTGYFDSVPTSTRVLSPLPQRASFSYSGFSTNPGAHAYYQIAAQPPLSATHQIVPHVQREEDSEDGRPTGHKRTRHSTARGQFLRFPACDLY